MHARGNSSRRDGGARASFCRDTFVALCASLLNLPGLIWTIELLIVERFLAHVVTPHKFVRLKPRRLGFTLRLLFIFYIRKATLHMSMSLYLPFYLLDYAIAIFMRAICVHIDTHG